MESNISTGFVEEINLKTIFSRIIDSPWQTEISLKNLKSIIDTDLDIPQYHLNILDDARKETLPYMLMKYIHKWPGWSKKEEYDKGSMDLYTWMSKFRNYICYKMRHLVMELLPHLEEDEPSQSESNSKQSVNCGTQTESKVNFSNFNIELAGPPTILNNIVFSGLNDDVRVELHPERPWIPLEYSDLLNYPYVEVEFNSRELSFKRSFDPKITRYLSRSSETDVNESNFILGKSKLNGTSTSNSPIEVSILGNYINTLKNSASLQIPHQKQQELANVLDEFYQDMVDISNKNSVFENRRVMFNIGGSVFKRTKRIANGGIQPEVVLNEVFIPRVTSSFRYFTAAKDAQNFNITASFNPDIAYKCIFCKNSFNGTDARTQIMNHMKIFHRRAQTLVCMKCKKCVEVVELSRQRWKCKCSK